VSSFFYYLGTAVDSLLSVFGIRAPYEQPKYQVIAHAGAVEIRDYAPRVAVETPVLDGNEGAAFGRLFRYITGANVTHGKIAMTVPVEMSGRNIPMTVPVETASDGAMRFFLPSRVAAEGAPAPTEKDVHLVNLPAITMGVVTFSGVLSDASRAKHEQILLADLKASPWHPTGGISVFSYDPPFSLPFTRRNEVAIPVAK
jgi:hypothetical protein